MAIAKTRKSKFESRAHRLNVLADSIPVRNSIDEKVVDLFREAAAVITKSGAGMMRKTGR